MLCGIYAAVAIAGLIVNRRHLAATVRAPFVGTADPARRSPARGIRGRRQRRSTLPGGQYAPRIRSRYESSLGITGGAGGMGLATAKIIGRDHARGPLRRQAGPARPPRPQPCRTSGSTPTIVNCDVTDRSAVDSPARYRKRARGDRFCHPHRWGQPEHGILPTTSCGPTHSAPSTSMRRSTRRPAKVSVIVNVASMAAHLLPAEIVPTAQFPLALHDSAAFIDAMMTACSIAPEEMRSGIAYAVSKSFVRWYSQSQAERFNARGLRIVSISPGSVDTEMGRLEEEAGGGRDGRRCGESRDGASRRRWQSYSPSVPATKRVTSPAPTSSTTVAWSRR